MSTRRPTLAPHSAAWFQVQKRLNKLILNEDHTGVLSERGETMLQEARRLARKMGVTLVTTPSGWIGYADCVTAREE